MLKSIHIPNLLEVDPLHFSKKSKYPSFTLSQNPLWNITLRKRSLRAHNNLLWSVHCGSQKNRKWEVCTRYIQTYIEINIIYLPPGSIDRTGPPEDDRHWMYLLCGMWAFNLGVRGGGGTQRAGATDRDLVVAATTSDATVVTDGCPESAAAPGKSSGAACCGGDRGDGGDVVR